MEDQGKSDESASDEETRLSFLTTEDIRRIISLPTYRGVVRVRRANLDRAPDATSDPEWEEFRGRQTPIVDDELWFKANRMLKATGTPKPHRIKAKGGPCVGLFQGMLVCASCDAAMSPGTVGRRRDSGEPHRYYRCTQLVRGGTLSACTTRQISCDAVEAAVLSLIQSVEENPACFARLGFDTTNRKRDAEISKWKADLFEVEEKISANQHNVRRFVEFVSENGSSKLNNEVLLAAEKSKQNLVALENQRINVEGRLFRLSAKVPQLSELAQALGTIGRALSVSDFPAKREIYRQILKQVTLRRVVLSLGPNQSDLKKRTYRITAEFRTNQVMSFGRSQIEGTLPGSGYGNIELKVTFEVFSNRKEQKIVMLEHGYSTVSSSFVSSLRNNSLPSGDLTPVAENPIQRAIRWKTLIESGGKNGSILSAEENVSKGLISQHLALLRLPQVIVDFLKNGGDSGLKRAFSVRELQRLQKMTPSEAIHRFQARVSGALIQDAFSLESKPR